MQQAIYSICVEVIYVNNVEVQYKEVPPQFPSGPAHWVASSPADAAIIDYWIHDRASAFISSKIISKNMLLADPGIQVLSDQKSKKKVLKKVLKKLTQLKKVLKKVNFLKKVIKKN